MEHGLNVIKPLRVNDPQIVQSIVEAGAEANVVVAFGQKIGDALIASPRLGPIATINLHASLLPKYRGAAPIHWAIMSGEKVTGNTVFSLVDRMDAGDVLARQAVEISPHDTTGDLHDKLAASGAALVLQTLERLRAGAAAPERQDEAAASLAPKLSRKDAVVDFNDPADRVRCRIHGLSPWPGVEVFFEMPRQAGLRAIKLLRVESVGDCVQAAPGFWNGSSIACGQGELILKQVQLSGGRPMSGSDFLRGHPLPVGTLFSGKPPQ